MLANSVSRIIHTINVLEAKLAAARQRIEELETSAKRVVVLWSMGHGGKNHHQLNEAIFNLSRLCGGNE